MAQTIKVIPKKSFLLRVEDTTDGKRSRIIATKGEATEVYPNEAKQFAKNFVFVDQKDNPVKKKGLTVK